MQKVNTITSMQPLYRVAWKTSQENSNLNIYCSLQDIENLYPYPSLHLTHIFNTIQSSFHEL